MTIKEVTDALAAYYKELLALGADREAVAIREFALRLAKKKD